MRPIPASIWQLLLFSVAPFTTPALSAAEDLIGLIGHWKLDHPAAAVAGDSSGGGHDGSIRGATATQGILGRALRFDGEDDYVELGDLGEYESVTIAFWMKADDARGTGGWQGLVTSDAWEEGVLHIPLGRGVIDVHLHMGDTRRARLTSSKLASGTWYHVAVVADTKRREIRLFTNGSEEDVDDISPLSAPVKLLRQVVGREFDGKKPSRYFRGAIDDVRIYSRALEAREIQALCPDAPPPARRDPRNLRTGKRIPDEGYCDQPYTVINKDGHWLCTMTTGPGKEGDHGQHIVATISSDQGNTWSELVDIEPSDGPEASWVMPLATPRGRVYGFYTYNGEMLRSWQDKPIRTDTVGWYCYKYSDDGGRTWSKERYRLPLPPAPVDLSNTFGGKHQIFWGIGKPITHSGTVWFAFSRCGRLVVDKSEGWFFRSDNILTESDPAKIEWQLLPDGEHGLKSPEYGDVHAEQNLVALSEGSLYCMYRTITGYPFHAYSRDGGHTWTKPVHATYTPGGRKMKNPRACPRIWRCQNGKFLFWYHNHSEITGGGFTGRNPVWISGGIEKDGFIHWSQPEILLYDPNPSTKISYPDLIEQDDRYWITETQKTMARVHEIDQSLLEGLWNQGREKTAVRDGLVLELGPEQLRQGDAKERPRNKLGTVPIFAQRKWDCPPPEPSAGADLPETLDVEESGGISLDLWLQLDDLSAGQVILDSRTPEGRGLALVTTETGTIRIDLDDGQAKASWDCDPGVLEAGKLHHVAVIVDAGPKIISFVVDGIFCNGGDARHHGWGRYEEPLGDVSGTGKLHLAPSLRGRLRRLRVYRRYLRMSEAVANFHAGL